MLHTISLPVVPEWRVFPEKPAGETHQEAGLWMGALEIGRLQIGLH
jgi:hypothetical protein